MTETRRLKNVVIFMQTIICRLHTLYLYIFNAYNIHINVNIYIYISYI